MRTRIVWPAALALILALPGSAGAQVSSESGGSEPGRSGGRIDVTGVLLVVDGKQVSEAPVDRDVELRLTLMNFSEDTARNVVMRLDSGSEGVRMIESEASFGTISAGATATGTYAFRMAREGCTGWAGWVGSIASSLGEDTAKLSIGVQCPGPRLAVESVHYEGGDGDGIPEPGERLTVHITLKNYGIDPGNAITAKLSVTGPVEVRQDTSRWPDLAPGASAAGNTPFVIEVADDAKPQEPCSNSGGIPITNGDTAVSSGDGAGEAPPEEGTVTSESDESTVESEDPGVAFEGTLAISTDAGKFTEGFGTAIACAMMDVAAGGRPSDDSAAIAGRAEATSQRSEGTSNRTGAILLAVLVAAVAGGVFLRFRFNR